MTPILNWRFVARPLGIACGEGPRSAGIFLSTLRNSLNRRAWRTGQAASSAFRGEFESPRLSELRPHWRPGPGDNSDFARGERGRPAPGGLVPQCCWIYLVYILTDGTANIIRIIHARVASKVIARRYEKRKE